MSWTEAAEDLLAALLRMVPDTFRSLAEGAARVEAEGFAGERGAGAVDTDDVVRGWIETTPADQRDSLVAVLEELGIDPELYAEALSAEPEE
ncbi:MAG: DUF2621 family protein [Chloroflexi bacterium]|nr:MAG: DUF2621 family protein [Chloroflexota bacterium]